MKTYKFRAGFLSEVFDFLNELPRGEMMDIVIVQPEAWPDVDCNIQVRSMDLKNLINLANKTTDGHVIAQTINTVENYTGERDNSR